MGIEKIKRPQLPAFDFSSMKKFDWNSLKRLSNPAAAENLNIFLEKLPQHAGQTMLVIAGVAWASAGAMGLFTTVQLQKLTEIRSKLEEAVSLKPIVPVVTDVAVDSKALNAFVEKMGKIYEGVTIKANGPTILITADSTAQFAQFREAIGHVQNGGSGWKVNIDRLCVGRECDRHPLAASLKINKVSVDKPKG